MVSIYVDWSAVGPCGQGPRSGRGEIRISITTKNTFYGFYILQIGQLLAPVVRALDLAVEKSGYSNLEVGGQVSQLFFSQD
jgi:hypothetical protein